MATRGRKPTKTDIPLKEAKGRVIQALAAGNTVTAAMASVNRNPSTFRQWTMKDEEFKAKAESARLDAQGFKEGLEGLKNIGFAEFSEKFLDTKIYPHMQNWVDLLEGREPSWLHPAMSYNQANPNRILINVPPEHAKSTTITANYVTYRIVTNPNLRVVIVSKTQSMARKFLGQIKDRLTHPNFAQMQAAYGPNDGWQKDSKIWSADMIHFNAGRDSGEKDPTVQALGIGSQIYGARADLIILDDVVMDSNAHDWETMLNWIQTMVITRLGRHGKLLVLGTRVAPIDLYKKIRETEHWSGGTSPFTYLACPAVLAFDEDPKKWVTLWPTTDRPENEDLDEADENGQFQKWDGPALFARRSEVTPSVWAMVYQQEDVVADSIFSPTAIAGSVQGMRKRGPLKEGNPGHPRKLEGQYTIIGLDPAMAGATGAVVITYNKADGMIYVLDCVNMTDPSPKKIQDLIEEWVIKYKPNELRIEINAHQKAYALDDGLRNWLAAHGCRLESHFTGKNKWDTSFGVASMSTLFGTVRDGRHQDDNIIELPSNEGSEGLKTLVQELITWKPDTRNPTDCVMALWFAVIKVREMMQNNMRGVSFMNNRWATRGQNARRTTISLSELKQAQWADNYS